MDTGNKINETDLLKIWNGASVNDFAADSRESSAGARVLSSLGKNVRRQQRNKRLARATGAVLGTCAAVALGFFVGSYSKNTETIIQLQESYLVVADNGGQVLPDGSTIWMERGSKLRYSSNFLSDRTVFLEGNADFHVQHLEDNAPFYVELAGGILKVTGTSFSVSQSDDSELSVVLHEGKVAFNSSDGSFSHNLEPGHQFSYNPSNGTTTTKSFYPHIHWVDGNYKLENVPISELVDFLNWRYGNIVSIKGINDGRIRMNGIVAHGEMAESAVSKISYALKLKTTTEDGKIILYK